ncbi:hypothetical protein EV127DRAFT_145354 [Xylaria flabelliformis]|nr:hypothetical protein EV127DRAFT_145354 [Xylaria flabelliformis]
MGAQQIVLVTSCRLVGPSFCITVRSQGSIRPIIIVPVFPPLMHTTQLGSPSSRLVMSLQSLSQALVTMLRLVISSYVLYRLAALEVCMYSAQHGALTINHRYKQISTPWNAWSTSSILLSGYRILCM